MLLFVLCVFFLYIASISKDKIKCFDKEKVLSLKPILALCIILHHLSYRTDLLILFRPFGAPIVALFFFISGYGMMRNYMCKGKSYLTGFVGKRIVRSLLLPFIIALLIYCAVNYYSLPAISDILCNAIKGNPFLPYSWYVYSILIIYIAFFISAKCLVKGVIVANTVFIILFSCLLAYKGYDRCWYISLLAYPFGLIYSKYETQIIEVWKKNKFLYYSVVPISVLLLALLVATGNEFAYMFAYVLIPLIFVTLLSKVKIERLGKVKWIMFIGGFSYELYLSQGIAMSMLRGRFIYVNSESLYVILTLIATLAIAMLVHKTVVVLKCRI